VTCPAIGETKTINRRLLNCTILESVVFIFVDFLTSKNS